MINTASIFCYTLKLIDNFGGRASLNALKTSEPCISYSGYMTKEADSGAIETRNSFTVGVLRYQGKIQSLRILTLELVPATRACPTLLFGGRGNIIPTPRLEIRPGPSLRIGQSSDSNHQQLNDPCHESQSLINLSLPPWQDTCRMTMWTDTCHSTAMSAAKRQHSRTWASVSRRACCGGWLGRSIALVEICVRQGFHIDRVEAIHIVPQLYLERLLYFPACLVATVWKIGL